MPPDSNFEFTEEETAKQASQIWENYQKQTQSFKVLSDVAKKQLAAKIDSLNKAMNKSLTDNPSIALLKELFSKTLAIWHKATPDLKTKITQFVCEDTVHNNLANYQSDFNIPIAFKIHKYSSVIQAAASENSDKSTSIFSPPGDYILPKNYSTTTTYETSKELKLQLEQLIKEQQDKDARFIEVINKLEADLQAAKEIQQRIVEVRSSDGTKLLGERIVDKHHYQLPEILQALTARNAQGFPEQLYIWGAPGAGKTHLSLQIAKALGVRCFAYPMGPTITEGKLLGFNNIATGTFVAGWLYDAYKNGGLVALDEADLADASVLGAANSIDNDRFIFGNGEQVFRHKDFYLIAFANTIGTGSTKGFIRNTLDAATRDRFTVIKLEYDERLELEIYGNADWARYVQKIRAYVSKHCQNSIYITPRATRKGAAYLAAGIDPGKVLDWTIFKGCSEDVKSGILGIVGKFSTSSGGSKDVSTKVDEIVEDAHPDKITWPGFHESFSNLCQNKLSLQPSTKIADIKALREWFYFNQYKQMSLGYTKIVIETWNNFYNVCINYKGLPKTFLGYNIYGS